MFHPIYQSVMKKIRLVALFVVGALAVNVFAQEDKNVVFHGSVQSDIMAPQQDDDIKTGVVDDWALTNTYIDLGLRSKWIDAGTRLEFTKHPLPGFEEDFRGNGIPHLFIKGKFKGFDVTLGDLYYQFGSGFIFRAYEERSLGIDNAIRGARINVTGVKGVQFKVLGGLQRRYWEWSKNSMIAGADLEINVDQFSQRMRDRGVSWMIAGSYVLKNETDEDIVLSGTNYRLNLPKNVHAFDGRTSLRVGDYSFLAEYAWKSQDPSFDNGYIYRHGQALMLSASYSKRGVSALIQAKRSEDMSFRSQRSMTGISAFLNNMPAFAYQHTYALAALYPYATQAADGEWAFQGEFGYNFKRNTILGGKYGTKVKLNVSHIRSLDKTPVETAVNRTTYGTDGYTTRFFKVGKETYYQDINVQLEKKLNRNIKLNLMYMNQCYNMDVV